jgi:hypothetical protein
MKRPKRPRDVSQLAKMMVDIASGESVELAPKEKDPAAVKRGRAGGEARRKSLPAPTKSAIASHAARKRWEKN